MSSQGTPAGWYPDPQQPGIERWWDGTTWGDQVRPVDAPVVPPAPAPFEPPAYGGTPGGVSPTAPTQSFPAGGPPPVGGSYPAAPPQPGGGPFAPAPGPGPYPGPGSPPGPGSGSGGSRTLILVLGGLGLLAAVGIVAAIALVAAGGSDDGDDIVAGGATTTAPDGETGGEPGGGIEPTTTTIAPENAPSQPSTPAGGGDPDVVSCTRIDDENVEVELVNSSDSVTSYILTIAFFDGATRLSDESGFINNVRPGERLIQQQFVFETAGTTCEIIDVDRFPSTSPDSDLDDVDFCELSDEPDFFGDFQGSASVTNGSGQTSDYGIDVAFIGPDGVRRGDGSVFIDAVRPGETAPGDVFSTAPFLPGYTCEVIGVTRTES